MIEEAETSNSKKSYNCNFKGDVTKQNDSVGKVEDWIKTNVAKQVEQENRKFPFIRYKDVFLYYTMHYKIWNMIINLEHYPIFQ